MFDKIQHPIVIKTLSTLGIEENSCNLIKGIYEKLIVNTKLSGERLISFSLISESSQGFLLSPLLFNSVLDSSRCNKFKNETRGIFLSFLSKLLEREK